MYEIGEGRRKASKTHTKQGAYFDDFALRIAGRLLWPFRLPLFPLKLAVLDRVTSVAIKLCFDFSSER